MSAIAAQRAYPHLFSGIELAKRREDYTKKDVEYYDNAGMPWDQKAGVSNPNGGEEADSIGGISTSIGKQMDDDHKFPQKDAPALKDPTQVPEGPQKTRPSTKYLKQMMPSMKIHEARKSTTGH